MPPKFLENIVILCFESRFSKQNSVIRGAARIFLKGGAEVMEAKALKRKNCL